MLVWRVCAFCCLLLRVPVLVVCVCVSFAGSMVVGLLSACVFMLLVWCLPVLFVHVLV